MTALLVELGSLRRLPINPLLSDLDAIKPISPKRGRSKMRDIVVGSASGVHVDWLQDRLPADRSSTDSHAACFVQAAFRRQELRGAECGLEDARKDFTFSLDGARSTK